jgi:predicted neuraminidase
MVMAFNNSPRIRVDGHPRPGPRKPLTLAISSDYGKTWPWMRNIATGRPGATSALEHEKLPGREAYSYPSVVQDPDGKIDVAFTYRRETIKFMRLPESWIKKDKAPTAPKTHPAKSTSRP